MDPAATVLDFVDRIAVVVGVPVVVGQTVVVAVAAVVAVLVDLVGTVGNLDFVESNLGDQAAVGIPCSVDRNPIEHFVDFAAVAAGNRAIVVAAEIVADRPADLARYYHRGDCSRLSPSPVIKFHLILENTIRTVETPILCLENIFL